MNIGMIGAGAIARRAHLPAWKSLPDVKVSCIADLSKELAEKVSSEFEVSNWTSDYQDILNDELIDVVDICTPTPSHYEIAKAALSAGKHVIIEKPLTQNLKEAIDLYKRSTRAKCQVCIIQNWRYLNSVRNVHNLLQRGALGNLITVHGRSFTHVPVGWTTGSWLYRSSAVLFDFTPHLVDLILWLVRSPIKSVFASGKDFTDYAPFLSSAEIIVTFQDGTVAILATSWEINYQSFMVDLYGSGGRISLDLKRDYYEESHGPITPLHEAKSFVSKMSNILRGIRAGNLSIKQLMIYETLFKKFLESVEIGTEPPMTIKQGVRTNLTLEMAEQSIIEEKSLSAKEMVKGFGLLEEDLKFLL